MNRGKIVKLVRHRGFGFVRPDESEEDIFFHHSNIEMGYFADLSVGDILNFEIEVTEKGPEAKNICILEKIDLLDMDQQIYE